MHSSPALDFGPPLCTRLVSHDHGWTGPSPAASGGMLEPSGLPQLHHRLSEQAGIKGTCCKELAPTTYEKHDQAVKTGHYKSMPDKPIILLLVTLSP